MRRKLLTVIFLGAIVFSICACGNDAQTQEQTSGGVAEDLDITETKPDWVDCKFMIDGTEYQLPFDMSQLIDKGWTTSSTRDWDYSEVLLDPKSEITNIQADNKNYELNLHGTWFDIANTSDKQITADKGTVIRVHLDISDYIRNVDNQPEFVLGGKVTWGSTKEDVIELLGEPTNVYDSTGDIEYNYNNYEYYMEFSFDDEDGGLEGVVISINMDVEPATELKFVEE